MSYDASAQNLRCPFCGSQRLTASQDTKSLAPRGIVPFTVDTQQAEKLLAKWLGSSFWRPRDLVREAVVTKMAAVYVPYWIFRARTKTYWNADTSELPFGARGDWRPLHGRHQGEYRGVLVGASGTLTSQETNELCPYDLAQVIPPGEVDMEQQIYEPFTVQRKYARPLARHTIEQLEAQACSQYVPGRMRNMKVNVLVEDLYSEPVLLPVWIMAYRYRDRVYRFLLNGQTGRASGQAPFDWVKLWLIAGGLIGLLLFLVLVGMFVALLR